MTPQKTYKMPIPTGGLLYASVDERGDWSVEIRGVEKWYPIQKSDEPIWISNRRWDKLPEVFEIDQSVWNEFRQGTQVQAEAPDKVKTPEEEEGISEEIVAKAIEILKTGKPIQYLLDVYNKIHIGDRELGQILTYCTASQINKKSKGLHPKLSGESGMGKSDAIETYLHLLPSCAYIRTSLSSKAIFYHDIKPGTIIFLDDYKQNDDLDTIIKQTSSRFHKVYEHRTIDKDRSAQIMIAPPEIVWAITSVDTSQDMQVLNRQVGLDIDGTEDQTKKVIDHLLEDAGKPEEDFPITEEVLICRAMVLEMKKHSFMVTIPFWKRIKWTDYSSRRNPSIFLDMIRSNAVWNFMQRNSTEEDFIEASEQDFQDAKTLYVGRADTLIDKLSKSERRLAEAIIEKKGEIYREEAANMLKVSVNRISQLVHGENGKTGLLQKLPGFDVEKVTLKEEDKNVQKVRLVLKDYDRFKGLDAIVTLEEEPRKPSKTDVSLKLTPKTVSGHTTSKLISNIDSIIEENLPTSVQEEENIISSLKSKTDLLIYEGSPDIEDPVRTSKNKISKEEENAMLRQMEEEEQKEAHINAPTNGNGIAAKALKSITLNYGVLTPFSLSMIIKNLGGEMSPKESRSYLIAEGYTDALPSWIKG
jgi:hypothetical protein